MILVLGNVLELSIVSQIKYKSLSQVLKDLIISPKLPFLTHLLLLSFVCFILPLN